MHVSCPLLSYQHHMPTTELQPITHCYTFDIPGSGVSSAYIHSSTSSCTAASPVLGVTEISELDDSIVTDQTVSSLDISMGDAVSM